MKHNLLVVLAEGETWPRVADYVGRACGGVGGSETRLVLFTLLPGLPPWIEGGEPGAATTQRERFETEARAKVARLLEQVRAALLTHGVAGDRITDEVAEETPRVVDEMLAAARRHGCDTIVIGRHHKSMVREFFAGDPEEKLLRHPTGFTVWLVE